MAKRNILLVKFPMTKVGLIGRSNTKFNYFMMKKELSLDDIYINISDSQNPLSQETLDSLPKINRAIRERVQSHRLKFFQTMGKKIKIKREQENLERSLRLKN